MSYSILRLRNLRIETLERSGGEWVLGFSRGYVEKVMDRAEQRTLWQQAGEFVIAQAREDGSSPEIPFVVASADVEDSLYTQRDMVRIPLDVSGQIALRLRLAEPAMLWCVTGSRIQLRMAKKPRYVRHLNN